MAATLIEAGCDYITATCQSGNKVSKFVALADSMLLKEKAQGNDIKSWGAQGYRGYTCGSVMAGKREDGWMIRASSTVAHANWKKVYALASNVSRFDLQGTWRLDVDVDQFIRTSHRQARARAVRSGRAATVELRDSTDSTSTLYIGKRVSDTFLRMYNKGGESKLDHYQDCLRCEAEYKSGLAQIVCDHAATVLDEGPACAAYVSSEFARRGCKTPPIVAESDLLGRPRKRSDTDRRLLWLNTSVRGSVELLLERGQLLQVLAALGLEDVVTPNAAIAVGIIPTEGGLN